MFRTSGASPERLPAAGVTMKANALVLLGAALVTISCNGQGCNSIRQIGQQAAAHFADSDNDGWFDEAENRATTLTLTTITFTGTQQGRYRIIVDGVRFPNGPAIAVGDDDPNGWLAVAPTDTATMNV